MVAMVSSARSDTGQRITSNPEVMIMTTLPPFSADCERSEHEVATPSLPGFAAPNLSALVAQSGCLEKSKSGLGELCFLVTERCYFSFRFCRVRSGRWLECKLTGTSGYFSAQCTQLLSQ